MASHVPGGVVPAHCRPLLASHPNPAASAVSATPSANNLMVMVELSGGNRAAMSTSIFTQYMAAPLVLPITLTASVFVASCL
jgi:hypothetical protein